MHFVMPEKIEDLFHQWGGDIVKGVRGKMFIHALLQGILWGLWKERKRRVFEDKRRNFWLAINSIICEVASWVLMKDEFKSCNLNDIQRDWISCISVSPCRTTPFVLEWVPPPKGKVKINFYGASFGNLGPVGYGCLMRDPQGSII